MSTRRTSSAETAARFIASYGKRHDQVAEMRAEKIAQRDAINLDAREWRERVPDVAYEDLMAMVARDGVVDRVDAVLVMVMHGFNGAAIAQRIAGSVEDPKKFVYGVYRRYGISGHRRRDDARRALTQRAFALRSASTGDRPDG